MKNTKKTASTTANQIRMIKQKISKPKLTERHIQESCSDFLALDGWRRIRMDLPHLRGLGVAEKGIADDLYIRYLNLGALLQRTGGQAHPDIQTLTQVMWIEWKRKTGKAAQHQLDWHAAERAGGALTLIAGRDFPATIEGFQSWYMSSGLNRRMSTKEAGAR